MNKDNSKANSIDATETEVEGADSQTIILTPEQQYVKSFVKSASKDAPKLKDVEVLFEYERPEMEIPKGVRRQGRVYAWIAKSNLNYVLGVNGGKWEIVTRSNHPKAPNIFFNDGSGAIEYKGQNILCFCRETVMRLQEEKTRSQFNTKSNSLIHKMSEHGRGIYVEETDFNKEGNAIYQENLKSFTEVNNV